MLKNIRVFVAVFFAKLANVVSKIIGKKGSSIPGQVALKIYPDILRELSRQIKREIIVVCGTNGKTTTNNMTATILKYAGFQVVCNYVGGNMLDGVTSAFVNSADIWGRIRADYACLEIDEAWTVKVFDHLTPSKIVLTNLFRDQLDRYGEIDITSNLLEKAFNKTHDCEFILNGDDPLTARFGVDSDRKCYYFGVSQSENSDPGKTKEGRYCSFCGNVLEYHFYHYGQLGDYFCTVCGFKRPVLDFFTDEVDLNQTIKFNLNYCDSDYAFDVPYRGFYNVYNILAAVSVTSLCGVTFDVANAALQGFKPQIGRMETFMVKKPVVLNLSKNPASFNQSINMVLQDERHKNIMIVINDNAQDGKDISWLWDVEFEKFCSDKNIRFIVSGTRKEDMAVRLKYADVDVQAIETDGDLKSSIERLINMDGEIGYILVNYTSLFTIQGMLKDMQNSYEQNNRLVAES